MVRGRGGYPEEKSPSWSESRPAGLQSAGGFRGLWVGGASAVCLAGDLVGRKVSRAAVHVRV